ncbi:MAG: ATPase, T2SS/T4P/T4SS family [Myxococcota bacterium]|nr:Flp pilus assembly complex ATPase component TadA [Myxococcales bacterium]
MPEPSAIARLLLDEGVIDRAQLRYAERVHAKLATKRPMADVLRELFAIELETVRDVLRKRRTEIRLGELLVELGHLTQDELAQALELQQGATDEKQRLGEVLVDHGFIDESTLVDVLSLHLGVPREEPDPARIRREDLPRFPIKWCQEHDIVPMRRVDGGVVVAFYDPTSKRMLRAAEEIYGKGNVVPAIARRSAIREALANLGGVREEHGPLRVEESAVVRVVDELLQSAVERGASDVHVEPRSDRIHVRFREDGVLVPYRDFPLSMASPLASRIKVLCNADITERRRHQGGRFMFDTGRHHLDMRVSMYVTVHGEKIVLRLLNHDRRLVTLQDLGMGPRMLERFREGALELPSGVLLVTGPTGSGKTTTLYSCIDEIRNEETSIITAEDPVEYVIDGIAQCSINPAIDLSYEETLRHIVRQDPDVIVIGEIRDTFSAEVAIQAALTGHKVLTTFHTEDTIGGLLRLLNMDIEAFLVSSTVVSVLAQRLLRKICDGCSQPYVPTPADVRRLGYAKDALAGGDFRVGAGCEACRHTGYKGRIAVFELLVLDAAVRDAILMRQTSHQIRTISRESSGLVSLLEDGIAKAAAGRTTIAEIVRMLPRLDRPRPLSELRRLVGA